MTEDELRKLAEESYGDDLLALYEDLDPRKHHDDLLLLELMMAERDWETEQERALEDGAGSPSPSTHQPKGTL